MWTLIFGLDFYEAFTLSSHFQFGSAVCGRRQANFVGPSGAQEGEYHPQVDAPVF